MKQPSRDFWKGKRICVTGGTGFLGYHLVRQLRELESRVRIFSLPPRPTHPIFNELDVEKVFGDVCDKGAVQCAIVDCDAILHTAGSVSVWGPALQRMREVHAVGTENIFAAANRKAQIVHVSSIVAVGATDRQRVFSEESSFNLERVRVDYVHAKLAAERIALNAGRSNRHAVVVNPGYLIGPEDHECSVMGRYCLRFWKGRVLIAPTGGMNLVDVRDVATGILLAAEHGQSGSRYILGGENHKMKAFMRLLAEAASMRPRGIPVIAALPLRAVALLAEGRAWFTGRETYPSFQHVRMNRLDWFVSSERAEMELGYRSRPLRETLSDTYQWCQEQRMLSLRPFNRWWMRPDRGSRMAA
jgi:dihydroflavonol-4-reductase